MAFNKSKALEGALKYLNQGKVAQAIGEYQQILRHDPKDQATLMTVGDLYARQGDMSQAIEYFERLAQVYLGDGFNSKAIAIYKKIAKLAPNELAPLERLADLYVQQGVLSEARPLFLQIAEAYLKANRAPKAVEVLQRLLDVEPDNPRVQMRLAELYNVMGQKKEAAQTYLNYAQRLFDRGESEEAEKLAERAISVDGANADALLLKGKALMALDKPEDAVRAFEKHPDADAGGEVTNLIVDLELKAGRTEKAADRARNQMLRGSAHCGLMHHVVDSLIEEGKAAQALPLLADLRDSMIEAGEQDKYLKSLSDAAQHLPGDPQPLEMMADFCRHSSDPFRLSSALTQLVDVYSASGDYTRAEAAMQELVDRSKDDERLVQKLEQLRMRAGGGEVPEPVAQGAAAPALAAAEPEPEPEVHQQPTFPESTPVLAPPSAEETPDPETQKFIAQALTDVDLFSSYGLTQKATHLLETVLERVPRHTPTLERLLDFHLGSGNERRTAELASQLEQIYAQRGDTQNSERFSELRMRFQAAAGMTAEELPSAPPLPSAAEAAPVPTAQEAAGQEFAVAAPPAAEPAKSSGPAEFEISLVPLEEEDGTAVAEAPAAAAAPAAPAAKSAPAAPATPAAVTEEVDLSDEWEAMLHDAAEPETAAAAEEAPMLEVAVEHASENGDEPVLELIADPAVEPEIAASATHEDLDPPVMPVAEPEPEIAVVPEPVAALDARPGEEDFELELLPDESGKPDSAKTTDDLISELVAEFGDEEVTPPVAQPAMASSKVDAPRAAPEIMAKATPAQPAAAMTTPTVSETAPPVTAESLNQLSEVFQEFRSEFGEMGAEEDEDLETHYNLGIAYREMGLLDEAIGEFQKVAKAVQKGKPFQYAMNCSTLLALSFSDKGEPKIAAIWYQRALEVPGLDQESVLALRYDLGVSFEMAGESKAALDSFRQVYAMNIDYRDVSDRIAALQKR